MEYSGVLVLGLKLSKGCDNNPPVFWFFLWNSPLLNGLNPTLGNIAILANSQNEVRKKTLIGQKKKYSFKDSSSWPNILSLF